MNALDDIRVHLDWLVAGLAQSIRQPLLLGVKETHRPGCRPPALLLPHRRGGAVSLARFGVSFESGLAQCERRRGLSGVRSRGAGCVL
jgi:hypothetical protein